MVSEAMNEQSEMHVCLTLNDDTVIISVGVS